MIPITKQKKNGLGLGLGLGLGFGLGLGLDKMTTQTINFHGSMSMNKKTGHMLVTTSSDNTCPPSCAHLKKGTCYAKLSFLGIHWRKVSAGTRSTGFRELLGMVRGLPNGRMWRHNQGGDLPGIGEEIDQESLNAIVEANKGKRGFTYTHKYNSSYNLMLIGAACDAGFTINLSADSIEHAVELHKYNIPVTLTVPFDDTFKTYVYKGITFVPCPGDYESIKCTDCKMCAIPDRKTVIMFKAHGSRKRSW